MRPDGTAAAEACLPVPASARERRERTRAVLAGREIDVPPTVALVQGEEEALIVHEQDVAARALALWATAARATGGGRDEVLGVLRGAGADDAMSPQERAFVGRTLAPTAAEAAAHSWRWEGPGYCSGRWAWWKDLRFPADECDPGETTRLVRSGRPGSLVEHARLRPLEEILDAYDLTYCCHWAALEAHVDGRQPPGEISPGVAAERLRALNWLLYARYADWDDVRTDA